MHLLYRSKMSRLKFNLSKYQICIASQVLGILNGAAIKPMLPLMPVNSNAWATLSPAKIGILDIKSRGWRPKWPEKPRNVGQNGQQLGRGKKSSSTSAIDSATQLAIKGDLWPRPITARKLGKLIYSKQGVVEWKRSSSFAVPLIHMRKDWLIWSFQFLSIPFMREWRGLGSGQMGGTFDQSSPEIAMEREIEFLTIHSKYNQKKNFGRIKERGKFGKQGFLSIFFIKRRIWYEHDV